MTRTNPAIWGTDANVQTPVSSTSYFIHRDPAIFPSPDTFDPERWTGDGAMALKRYLVPFTKGNRICLGMNLALLEIYRTLATLVRTFDMQLCNTQPEDLHTIAAYMTAVTRRGKLQVYVKVTGLASD